MMLVSLSSFVSRMADSEVWSSEFVTVWSLRSFALSESVELRTASMTWNWNYKIGNWLNVVLHICHNVRKWGLQSLILCQIPDRTQFSLYCRIHYNFKVNSFIKFFSLLEMLSCFLQPVQLVKIFKF